MFVIKKIDRKTIIAVLLAILLLLAIGVKLTFLSRLPTTAYCESVGNFCIHIDEHCSFTDFFEQFNIAVDENTMTESEITIPSVFNAVYESYNALQKNQGFDLNDYKGQKAVRYTFDVLNDKEEYEVKANIIVCENRVIAGDLCTYALDGMMTTLTDKTMIQG